MGTAYERELPEGRQRTPRNSGVRSGWRFSLCAGACTSLVVLIINTAVTIWSSTPPEGNDDEDTGRRIIFEGSCTTSHNLGIVLHLVVNILSSVLLAASNYGMQCLSAPTRREVNEAHLKGRWLDIGIPSIRNLSAVPIRRRVLWLLLVLSSVLSVAYSQQRPISTKT